MHDRSFPRENLETRASRRQIPPGLTSADRSLTQDVDVLSALDPGKGNHMYSYDTTNPSATNGQFAKNRAVAEEGIKVQRGQAVRTVAGHAHDAQDLRALLAMLGLEAAGAPGSH